MLDDVEIRELNLREMINVKEKYKIEILSPKVINSTHKFMNSYASHILTINNALEVYCLLLKYKDFQRFLSIHTIENKWMWGADFLFGFFNIKTGVYNRSSVKHMLLPSKRNTNNAEKLMRAYLRDVNFYGAINSIIAINNIINLRTGASAKVANNNNNNENDSGKLMTINFNKNSPHKTKFNYNNNNNYRASNIKRTQVIDNNAIKLLSSIHKPNKYRQSITDVNNIKYSKITTDKRHEERTNRKKIGASKSATFSATLGATLVATLGANKSKTYTNKNTKFTINNLMY